MLDFGSSSDEESDDEDKSSDSSSIGAKSSVCDEDCSDEELFEREFLAHKRNYYIQKMKYPEMTK